MPSLPTPSTARQAKAKKSTSHRTKFIYLALVLCMSWGAYILFTGSTNPSTSDNTPPVNPEGQYGLNARPGFKDLIQLADLPSAYLPETGKHRSAGRLVVVGDVHGMKKSLLELLEKIDFDSKHDHLILAGDMISKGPDSRGVIDLAMELGATGVRGNHEDRIILAHADMVAQHVDLESPGPSEDADKVEDDLEELSFSHGDYKDRALVKLLGEKRIKWLAACPVILRVGDLGNMGEVVVVHAGLAPGVELKKQDPTMVMNMRTIDKDGVPSDEFEGKGWMKVWNKHQKALPSKKRTTVIYGHDSKRGLVKEKFSLGIDTGCVKGGQLTAVVIEGGHSERNRKLVHVGCKDERDR